MNKSSNPNRSNVLTGQKDVNDIHYYGGRAALGWQISDDWKVRLSGLYQHFDGAPAIVDYDSTTFRPEYGGRTQSRPRDFNINKQNIGAYSLLIDGDLGFATLTSASTYDHVKQSFTTDFSPILSPAFGPVFGIPNLGFGLSQPNTVNKYTQEVRLASPTTNPLAWQIGGFFTRETQRIDASIDPLNQLTGARVTGLPQIGALLLDTTFRELAVFGDVTYHFSSAFNITAGLRYSDNKQSAQQVNQGLVYGNATFNTRSHDSAVTFLVNPSLHLDKNTMIYARVASGYRPGGPNSVANGAPQTYRPDKVTDYEIGLKSDLLDRKLSLELAAYWINWRNIQIQRVNPLGSFIDNGPSAVSRGAEASATLRPLRGLDLYANVAYNDAHLTQDLPVGSALGLSGDRLPLTPSWSGAAGASYTVPLFGDWNGDLGFDWRHVGAKLGAFPNPGQVRFQYSRYDTVDLRAGVSNDRWNFTIYVKNVGDAFGANTDVNLGAGTTSVAVIQPRTFGISASAKF